MNSDQNIEFKISTGENFVKLEPIELIKYDSEIDWDKNWVKTKVFIKGGQFSGTYIAEFMTTDFEQFKQELFNLYDNLKGAANFKDLEGYLELKISGNGLGHFTIEVRAHDSTGVDMAELKFSLSFDQTQIKDFVYQLEKITKFYPITGDFKIQNETLKIAH